MHIENNIFLEEKLWLKPYTLNGLRESQKAFRYLQEKIKNHYSLKQLCDKHPEDNRYIRDCSCKYHWPEREKARIQYELLLFQSIQEELLTIISSKEKITRNIEIDDHIERIIQRVLDLIDLKIDSMMGEAVVSEELRKVKLPSMLMALEKLLSGRNTHYRNLLRQLGLPETLHEKDEDKLVIQKVTSTKPSDEELRKNIDEKLEKGSQKIERRDVYN